MTLSGNNSYSGGSTISAGVLQLGSATALTTGSFVVNATLDLNGFSEAIDSLSGNGTIRNSVAGSVTLTVGSNNGTGGDFSGNIQANTGTISLTKTGNGTQTLSGNNTFTGSTTVAGGTLALSGSSSNNISGSTLIDVQASGTLNVSG